ncbi:hypothetical protein HY502_03965 [Candidatus Woesebacteria bacterium]|nr:hypothetical protein [Candidatus Woesebacteria bacterium]
MAPVQQANAPVTLPAHRVGITEPACFWVMEIVPVKEVTSRENVTVGALLGVQFPVAAAIIIGIILPNTAEKTTTTIRH